MGWSGIKSYTVVNITSITDIPTFITKTCFIILQNEFKSSTLTTSIRYNSDNNTNYAYRQSYSGGADSTSVSQTGYLNVAQNDTNDEFNVTFGVSILSQEKLFISFGVNRNTSGAANAPTRVESVGKWANTSHNITKIDKVTSTSTLDQFTNVSIIGTSQAVDQN